MNIKEATEILDRKVDRDKHPSIDCEITRSRKGKWVIRWQVWSGTKITEDCTTLEGAMAEFMDSKEDKTDSPYTAILDGPAKGEL